ncbi:hypothetical protein AAG747_26285 [Rapidithrix thailandica]|uniref:Uncharacterized protein n=1 Tax=Rapidithrix thailandica TaxID=413964 RepID=A0AAW9SC16_9BACT
MDRSNSMIKQVFFYWVMVIVLSCAGCSESVIETGGKLRGEEYYPLVVGRYTDYDVHHILYHEFDEDEIFQYQMREVLADTFRNNEGQLVYRIEQLVRENESEDWEIDSVWTAYLDKARLIKQESNVPYIKLTYPLTLNKAWNGNATNTLDEELYTIDSVEHTWDTGELSFDNAVTVRHQKDSSLIHKDVRFEVYAEEGGMVYKKSEVYQYINDSQDPDFGKNIIASGYFLEMKARDTGYIK